MCAYTTVAVDVMLPKQSENFPPAAPYRNCQYDTVVGSREVFLHACSVFRR